MFQHMKASGCKPNSVIYNTLLGSFSRSGDMIEVHKLYHEMVADGIGPDSITSHIMEAGVARDFHS